MMIKNDRKYELAAQGLDILKKVSALALNSGYSQKEIAYALGKSEAWISQALSHAGQSTFTIGQVPFLRELLGLDLLRVLVNGSGCFVCENAKPSHLSVVNFAKVLKDFSKLADATAQAFEDGSLSNTEVLAIRNSWEHFKSTGERFVVDIERGSHAE